MILEDFNLENAERRLCNEALTIAGNIVGAAALLGITRHALKRRIIKLGLEWPRRSAQPAAVTASATAQPS
jgi:DNA-binding NtrC family response regulator